MNRKWLQPHCKDCARERSRAWRAANPEKAREIGRRNAAAFRTRSPKRARDIQLRSMYGVGLDEYEEMLRAQNNGCAICGALPGSKRHAVDHDHETGTVRALLCHPCNRAIGFMRDDPERLRAAALYLDNHRCSSPLLLTGVAS